MDVLGDLDGDGFVGGTDLQLVLSQWGDMAPFADPRGDCDMNGFIGGPDMQCVLNDWGQSIQAGAS